VEGDLSLLSEDQNEGLTALLARFSGEATGPIGLEAPDDMSPALTIPTLKIRQRMTTDPSCPEEARDGDLYTTTGDLPEAPVKFVPIAIWGEHTKWSPDGGNIECRSPDGKTGSMYGPCRDCPDLPWRDNKRQDCDKNLNAVILTEGMTLYKVRFSSTSYKAGSNLVKFTKAMPSMWGKFFSLASDKRVNAKGEFHIFETKIFTEAPNASFQAVARHLCLEFMAARKEYIADFYARLEEGSSTEGEAIAEPQVTTVTVDAAAEPTYDVEL